MSGRDLLCWAEVHVFTGHDAEQSEDERSSDTGASTSDWAVWGPAPATGTPPNREPAAGEQSSRYVVIGQAQLRRVSPRSLIGPRARGTVV